MNTVISADGTRISYERSGAGQPLVLVDGAFGHRAAGPSGPLAALLTDNFTVYTYDRRGRGESGDTQPYAVAREIEDLAALIEEIGGSAYVYGTSSGAVLTLESARAGIGITALAAWEPNYLVDDSRAPLPADYVEHLEELAAAGKGEEAVEYFMTAGAGLPVEFVAPLRGTPIIAGMASVAHTLAYDGRIVNGLQLDAARAAEITVPALVLDGGTTPWLSAGARALVAAMPAAEHRVLQGQSHDVSPQAMAPALIDYFSR